MLLIYLRSQSTIYVQRGDNIRIAHISDLHINHGNEFKKDTFEKGKNAVNSLSPKPDLIFITGDLTFEGTLPEYKYAKEKIAEFESPTMLIPGNHDSRHLGYSIFPEFFGRLEFYKEVKNIGILGLDSTQPDKDEGHIGREKYQWIVDNLKKDRFDIIGLHHHIIPVPNSGREQNIINDAGGFLDLVIRNNVGLILMGHRHVPFAVRVHRTLMVNAGTFSSARTRAHYGNSFNIIDIEDGAVTLTTHNIESKKERKMVEFDRVKKIYNNDYCTL
jgi:3',5'-cyclic AMP phosphodiesterase CpdA